MSFAPVLPATGVVGFKLLSRTEAAQREAFARQPQVARDVEYFKEKIGEVKTAADLVADPRLYRVALGAFGLDEEAYKRAFMRRILDEGTENPDALANRFVDPRYKEIADAFGFGNLTGAKTGWTDFAKNVTDAYRERQFEIAVGEQDEPLRLALNFRREIAAYANKKDPDGNGWFSIMGSQPLRAVFEGAFGLSPSFGQLDVDRQKAELQDFNLKVFGSKSLDVFRDEATVEKAIERFLVRKSIESGPSASTPGVAALTLLQSGGVGPVGSMNLLMSSVR